MGAATHLGINLSEYDAVILTLIPHYDELIDAAGAAVGALARPAPAVVDLGTGSGALAQAILKASPKARVTGIDEDAGMLAMAEKRLKGRITVIHGNFETIPIPGCDVISASFAFAALKRGGLIVSADCCLASAAALQRSDRANWLAHLRQNCSPAKAEGYLKAWAKEDVYFTLEQEMDLLRRAGFKAEIAFRKTCFAVVVGLK